MSSISRCLRDKGSLLAQAFSGKPWVSELLYVRETWPGVWAHVLSVRSSHRGVSEDHIIWKEGENGMWGGKLRTAEERKTSRPVSRQQRKLLVSQFPNRQTLPPQLIPGSMAQFMSLVWPTETPNLKSVWLDEKMKKAMSTKLTEVCHWGIGHKISDLLLNLQRRRWAT